MMEQQHGVALAAKQDKNDIASFSEETVVQMMELQKEELRVKAMELEQRKREDQHSFDFAQKTLELQKEDRHESRIKFAERLKVRYVFVIIVLLIVLGFFGYALHIGQGELVSTLIEKAMYYAAGVLSSYGYIRFKEKNGDQN